ncbi:zinc ribbon domain-containing protein [Tuwongella immobilis]|uniref:Zinc finger/thioredoxin putative domain-containing protein n=1 Tax=Tuwongella immobilis TaxID=692036 RepID=A0A6C2YIS3_9BACT|nr:hypothetical protein [Tuwongella immobilis]VIP01149.1 unnamed protein product [Tuwongella immobilis]VTR97724.1 unnamed protein product [Tuwongella immobilis]
MPVITCPQCEGKMRYPEDTPLRKVRCPACQYVFHASEGMPPAPPPPPASGRSGATPTKSVPRSPASTGSSRNLPAIDFEVVDDAPASPPPPTKSRSSGNVRDLLDRAGSSSGQTRRAKSRSEDDRESDDDDDQPRRRRRPAQADADDDDRPRRRQRPVEDEFDDDYEDDRPRRRRRREDDYEDDDDYEPRRREDSPAKFRQAALGLQLNLVGLCCIVASLGMTVLAGVWGIALGAGELYRMLFTLSGLAGIVGIIVGLVGKGFLCAGPIQRGLLGLAIAAVTVGGLHSLLVLSSMPVSRQQPTFATEMIMPNGVRFAELAQSGTEINWSAAISRIDELPGAIWRLLRGSSDLRSLLAGLFEAAGVVLLLLYVSRLGIVTKARGVGDTVKRLLIGGGIGLGVLLVVNIALGEMIRGGISRSMFQLVYVVNGLLPNIALLIWFIFAALTVQETRAAVLRRSRR